MPDPWGIRRAENLLTSLEGVLSARVVTTPLGEVSEIHILASAGLNPKQVVRNVESALLAHLGLKVDHRKISVAQTADVKPMEALEAGAVRDRALKRGLLFERVAVTTAQHPHRVTVTVSLTGPGGEPLSGAEDVPDTPKARLEGAARAAAALVERGLDRASLALDGVNVVETMDPPCVLAVVRALSGRQAVVLTGTAAVTGNAEQAAVCAVLDATNRWAALRRSA